MYRTIGILAFLCVAAGCTPVKSRQFRVIDAVSGQPLSEVWVMRSRDPCPPAAILFLPLHILSLHGDPPEARTDASGLAQFKDEGTRFSFSKEGYEDALAASDWRGFREVGGERTVLSRLDDGTVVVPMRQRGSEPAIDAPELSAGRDGHRWFQSPR